MCAADISELFALSARALSRLRVVVGGGGGRGCSEEKERQKRGKQKRDEREREREREREKERGRELACVYVYACRFATRVSEKERERETKSDGEAAKGRGGERGGAGEMSTAQLPEIPPQRSTAVRSVVVPCQTADGKWPRCGRGVELLQAAPPFIQDACPGRCP